MKTSEKMLEKIESENGSMQVIPGHVSNSGMKSEACLGQDNGKSMNTHDYESSGTGLNHTQRN